MAKKSTKQTTSRSNPKLPAKKSPEKMAIAKKSAKRSEGDAVRGAKTESSPPPPLCEVLDIPDDAFADASDCIDVADVQEEAWFQDRDGGPRTDAYRIGRGIHALGWLCLSSQLLRLKLRRGPTAWRTRSVSTEEAAACVDLAKKFEQCVETVDQSVAGLAAFLGDIAASPLAADSFREVRPAIRRHLQAVDAAEYESEGLIFPEKLSGDLEDAYAFEYPFHVRFGERIYSCDGLQKAFCRHLSEDLCTALQLGIEVDALLRRPVELHGHLHDLLGQIPNAELPTGPVGSVAELCRQVPLPGGSLAGIEELLHGPRDVGVVDAIDFEIRKALRAMPASPKPQEGGTNTTTPEGSTESTSTGGGKTKDKGSTANRPVPGYLGLIVDEEKREVRRVGHDRRPRMGRDVKEVVVAFLGAEQEWRVFKSLFDAEGAAQTHEMVTSDENPGQAKKRAFDKTVSRLRGKLGDLKVTISRHPWRLFDGAADPPQNPRNVE